MGRPLGLPLGLRGAELIIIGRASLWQSADEDRDIGPGRVIIDRRRVGDYVPPTERPRGRQETDIEADPGGEV